MSDEERPISDAEMVDFVRRLARQIAREDYDRQTEHLRSQGPAKHRKAAPRHFTMEEAASQLRVSRRWLQTFLIDHPFYRLAGLKKLFTAGDIQRLSDAMAPPPPRLRLARQSRPVVRKPTSPR